MPLITSDLQSLSVGGESVASVVGLKSVDLSQEVTLTPISCLGVGFLKEESIEPIKAQASFQRYVIGNSNYFRTDNIQGEYAYGDYGVSWATGRISSFEMSVEANSIPSETINIDIYDGIASDSVSFTEPSSGDIAISNNMTTNLSLPSIKSLNYSLTVNREISYVIGTTVPDIILSEPHELTVTISLNVGSEVDIPTKECVPSETDISISLKTCAGTTLRTYTAPNAKLQSSSLSAQVKDFVNSDIVYKSYLTTEQLATLMT